MNLVVNNVQVGHTLPLTEPLSLSWKAGGLHVLLGTNGA